jgi:hypothetical protein
VPPSFTPFNHFGSDGDDAFGVVKAVYSRKRHLPNVDTKQVEAIQHPLCDQILIAKTEFINWTPQALPYQILQPA